MAFDETLDCGWAAPGPAPWKVRVTRSSEHDRATGVAAAAADDDRALVRATLAGNREAFDTLVQRHQRHVYQLCYRFAGNHEDASDLAQDVFIRAYKGLRSFKGRSAFGTWLYRVGVNVCLNRVSARAATKTVPLEQTDRADHRAERADTALLRIERAAEVRAAIVRLPKKQRAALILRVYHELPHDEIADIVGSSVGAVKANFFHALANLRKLLQGAS